ncbi:MAG: hypothetical protein FWH26_06040, partial [Oscillospiraceae bacterium]|nr:hypothetical protein [Oscillospiraceae bacterium]
MKRIIAAALAFACVLLLASNAAYALDAKPSTLTVVIKYGDVPLDGIQTAVCLVAGVREADGTLVYEAVPAFAGAQADFTNLTAERN